MLAIKSNNVALQCAGLRLILSFSRSIRHLRTTLNKRELGTQICELVQKSDNDVKCLATKILSNMVLEFSPMRKEIISSEILPVLVQGLSSPCCQVKSLSAGAIKNLSSHYKDTNVISKILHELSFQKTKEMLFDADLQLQTLGLLRNLACSATANVVHMCQSFGGNKETMELLCSILDTNVEDETWQEVRTYLLCFIVFIERFDRHCTFSVMLLHLGMLNIRIP
eukprot:m.255090 g.255090  ORF g.255090 m.255090 type:complete len:225 (+) comp16179_c0_seq23:1325-1999(+)